MASSLIHCSHPMDYLVKTQSPSGQFTCSRCHCWGSGLHYRCQACGFVMHECCLEFPETISFFAHSWHNLHLHPADPSNPRQCDICNELVEGFCYSCISCGFHVHPHCTKAKQIVRSNIHAGHDLCLVPTNSVCSACNRSDGTWFYRCDMCNVSLHKRCLDGPIVPNMSHHHGQSSTQQVMHGQAYNSNSPIVPNHISPYFGYNNSQQMMHGQTYNSNSPIVPNHVSPYFGYNNSQQMMLGQAYNSNSPIVSNHVSPYFGHNNSQQIMHGQAYNSNSPIVPNHVSPYFGHNNFQQMMHGQTYNSNSPIVSNHVSPYFGHNNSQQMMHGQAYNSNSPIVPNYVSSYFGHNNSQQIMHGQAYNSNSPIVSNHVSPYFEHNMYSTPQMMMYGQASYNNVPVYNTSSSHGELNVSNILTNFATETISQVGSNLISDTLDNTFPL